MKNHAQMLFRALALPVLLSILNLQPSTIHAQGTAFTYQGRLNSGGSLANGSYDVSFTLFATNQTGIAVAGPVTNTAVAVTNGLFTTTVNFGPGIFTGTNDWLEIAVSTNGANAFSTLAPRQPLNPVPYAIFAESANATGLTGTIPAANVGGNYGNPVNFGNGLNSFDGTFYGLFYGSSFVGGTFVGSGSGLSDVWHTDGNLGTMPALNYLGTTDNQPLVIKVNAQEAFRFEPTTNTPNVVGGYSGNSVQTGLYGVTIGGGGAGGGPNFVVNGGNYATIAGGLANWAGGNSAMVGGGQVNYAMGDYSVIGGGYFNWMDPSDVASTIAGGHFHQMYGNVTSSTIGGGYNNVMETNAYRATIAGGNANIIHAGAYQATIGGGAFNVIGTNAESSVIAGGNNNTIQAAATSATIAGGFENVIGTNAPAAAIAGGYGNVVGANSYQAMIGSGFQNSVGPGSSYSVVVGGYQNVIGTNTSDGAMGGGAYNVMGTNDTSAVIAGGYNNTVGDNSPYSVIGGGSQNSIQTNMPYSFIGGGQYNTISYGFTNPPVGFTGGAGVAGGWVNRASGILSFVGGGLENTASGIGSAVLGGNVYQYTASNGLAYYIPGTGVAKGVSSTVVGGMGNQANGDFSLAAGYLAWANHSGTFVWADSQFPATPVFSSTTSNEFSIRAQNGVRIVADKGVHLNAANEPVIVRDWDVFATNAPAAKAGIGRWGMFIEPYNLTLGIPDTNDTADNLPRYFQVASYATNGAYTPLMVVDQSGNVTAAGSINGNGNGLNNVNAALLNGLSSSAFAPASGSSNYWTTTGNAGTTPGVNYIGTSDGQNLLIRGHFVGVGRTSQITSAEYFGVEAPVGSGLYGGMYIDTSSATAKPFYGYSQAGSYTAFHYVDGTDGNKWKLFVGSSNILTATPGGFVGIGTTAPDAALSVNGSADKPGGGSWTTFSDGRLKDIGANFTHGLEALEKIQPVSYHYKADNPLNLPSQPEYVGVVAQQVQKAVPEAVQPGRDGYLTVNNDPIIWTMVNAIKELNQKVDQKEAENAQLKQQLADLELRVQQLAQTRQK